MRAALDLEPRAGEVLGMYPDALPAVLHSPGYTGCQPRLAPMGHQAHQEDRAARERRWRSQMLISLSGRYRMVIGAAALHFLRARFPEVVREQTGHLLRLIDQDRVALQILSTTNSPASLQHGVIVLRHIPQRTDQAYLQQHTDWVAVPDLVPHLVDTWQQVQHTALSVADTRERVQHIHDTGDLSVLRVRGSGPPASGAIGW